MKLLILGATGNTGKELVTQAFEQNHEITVLVRDSSKLRVPHEKLNVIIGSVLDKAVLTKALEGTDAVISALGVGNSLKSNNLISNAVSTLIPAMSATGVKRVIFLSAFGVGETFKQASLIQKIAFRLFLKDLYADKTKADEQLRSSNLDWTLVFPAKLTNGPRTGKYTVGEKLKMKGFPSISRADVADFMLKQLADKSFMRKEVILMD